LTSGNRDIACKIIASLEFEEEAVLSDLDEYDLLASYPSSNVEQCRLMSISPEVDLAETELTTERDIENDLPVAPGSPDIENEVNGSILKDPELANPFSVKVEAFNQERNRLVYLESTFELASVQMLDSVAASLARYDQQLFETDEYDVKSVREYENWRLLSVGVAEMSEEIRALIDSEEMISWGTPMHSVIARQRADGTWESALQGTREYDELIHQTPDEWMSPEAKAIFADTP